MRHQALTLLWVTLYTFLLAPLAPLWAEMAVPVADGVPAPQVQHQPLQKSILPGDPIDLEAVVTSGAAIEEVVLLYRRVGATEYKNIRMKHRGDGRYTAKIPGKEVFPPGIEYFIQASDIRGSSTTYGQPLPPGAITIVPLTATVAPPPSLDDRTLTEQIFPPEQRSSAQKTLSSEDAWYKKWWVWTLVVTAAAGIAVAAGGGKGGSSGGGAPPPTTGTLTISGPVPKSP
jgi:hypothetical protein